MRHNNPFNPFNIVDKFFTQWVYKKARQAEKRLEPNCFVMYYLPHTYIYYFILSSLAVGVSFLVGKNEPWFLYVFFPLFSLGGLYLIFYSVSYRCYVDKIGITQINFFFFKKQLRWEDIGKVQIFENNPYVKSNEKEMLIRNRQNKKIFLLSYELIGFKLLVKLAMQKMIPVEYTRE